jgi:hypothetical protein
MAATSIARIPLASIADRCPAIFADKPSPKMSDKYGFFNTGTVLKTLEQEGYAVIKAHQDRAQSRDPRFVRHMVSLAHTDALDGMRNLVVGEAIPTINLINSHNGRTKFIVTSGLFRLVCSNGLMIADKGQAEQAKLRHATSLVDQVIARMRDAADRVTKVTQQIVDWRNIELTQAEMDDYARRAALLRFGEAGAGYDVESILNTRRVEDEGRSLWRVMNRVQENLMAGGVSGRSALGRNITSRPVNGITQDLTFNGALWELTEQVAA